ncbi:MAG: hypothetical protein HS115_04260 [Spirochaetales bacterium]|nr:hypothetical protein [Spirochaetales bacterium]
MSWYQDFKSFAEALNPLSDDLYKIILSLDALQDILDTYVTARIDYLSSIRITTANHRLVLSGEYILTSGMLSGQRVRFQGNFQIADAQDNKVILKIRSVKLARSGPGFDWIGMLGFALPGLRRLLVDALTQAQPEIFTHRRFQEVFFHTPYFLNQVPGLTGALGQIRIVFVRAASKNQVHFYVQSNQIVRSLVEYFGPQFLTVETIHFDRESLAMLWEEKD